MTSAVTDQAPATSTRARRIVVASELGYCWGVRRALDIVQDAASPDRKIAPIGDVIHNPQIVERLRAKGVEGQADFDTAMREGYKRVAITAHGWGPDMAQRAASAGVELIDSTCPLVTKVQRMAQKLARQGYFIVIYGDDYHPEVKSVLAWSGTSKAKAAKKVSQLGWTTTRAHTGEGRMAPPRKVALVSQTTKNVDELMAFARELEALVIPEGGEFRFVNTICEPTSERQRALARLIEEDRCDLILAIGGKKSSNTARLAEVGNRNGVESYHIERPEDIDDEWLSRASVVGITAGASTPDDVIQDVVDHLVGRGYPAPENGIRPVDPDYVPAY
jgi:4-hydroxy-3-methylbut-2-en-1-yl diphosphate reductase